MKKYTIEETFALLGDAVKNDTSTLRKDRSIEVDGYPVYVDSWRYRTFYHKGCDCVQCGRKGVYFKLDADERNPKRRHFNLYSEDDMLMTKDHIMPKSMGGTDTLDNFQTMCEECNKAKGNKLPVSQRYIKAENDEDVKYFPSLEMAIRFCCSLCFRNRNQIKRSVIVNETINITLKLPKILEANENYYGYTWSYCRT